MDYSINDVAGLIGGKVVGENSKVKRLMPFFEAGEEDLTFAADAKFISKLSETKAKTVIVPEIDGLPDGKTYIKVNRNPREIMPIILDFFKKKIKPFEKMVEASAIIGDGVKIAPNSYIGHDVEIGENTIIYPSVTICEGAKIGKNCTVYPNVTIREFCEIGDSVIIQPGTVIGSDGFGFVKVDGKNLKLEQIGRVIIKDDVEIGANCAIDRGAIGDTVIGTGTKLDNLVHIAHNDIIGENCLIIAQVGISGSVMVGDNVTIAGQTGVAGHLKIGDNVIIGAKSGVTSDIPKGSIVSGFPVRDHHEDLKIKVAMGRVPDMVKKIKEIEKKLEGNK